MERVEDLGLCAKCGGLCCLSAPGKFSPDELATSGSLDEQDINEALDSGLASMYTSFTSSSASKSAPIFTLTARGAGRPALSLCHEPTCCAHLFNGRCKFPLEKRPLECALMVPADTPSRCGLPDDLAVTLSWVAYQDLLRKVIEQRTGHSWREELMDQVQSRSQIDAYAQGARGLISSIGLAETSEEADAIIAAWQQTL